MTSDEHEIDLSEYPEEFRAGLERASKKWILLDGELVEVGLEEWARWFENSENRRVGSDDITGPDERTYWVSTVFLGIDHSFGVGSDPLCFETMIFLRHEPRTETLLGREYQIDKTSCDYQMRYATLEEAEAGHRTAIEAVLDGTTEVVEYDDLT